MEKRFPAESAAALLDVPHNGEGQRIATIVWLITTACATAWHLVVIAELMGTPSESRRRLGDREQEKKEEYDKNGGKMKEKESEETNRNEGREKRSYCKDL